MDVWNVTWEFLKPDRGLVLNDLTLRAARGPAATSRDLQSLAQKDLATHPGSLGGARLREPFGNNPKRSQVPLGAKGQP